jgi:hypothetical protein
LDEPALLQIRSAATETAIQRVVTDPSERDCVFEDHPTSSVLRRLILVLTPLHRFLTWLGVL